MFSIVHDGKQVSIRYKGMLGFSMDLCSHSLLLSFSCFCHLSYLQRNILYGENTVLEHRPMQGRLLGEFYQLVNSL